ncbi:MAG: J domain-containing protein [Promethearchaeia archaeon]
MSELANTVAFYQLLGLEKGAQTSQEDIKRAWRKAALRLHPDRNPEGLPPPFACQAQSEPAARFAAHLRRVLAALAPLTLAASRV